MSGWFGGNGGKGSLGTADVGMGAPTGLAYTGAPLPYPKVFPNSLKFPQPRQAAIAVKRDRKQFNSDDSTYCSTNNNVVRITLPNSQIIDFRRGSLQFTATLAKTGGSYVRLSQYASCWIDRLEIFAGSTLIEQITGYNLVTSSVFEMASEPTVNSTMGGALWGFGSQAQRSIWGATDKTYNIPLASGILQECILPLKYISDTIEIRLTMAAVNSFIETDGTLPVLTLSNVKLLADSVESPGYEQLVKSELEAKGLTLGFHSPDYAQSNTFNGAFWSVLINQKASNIERVQIIIRDPTVINDTTKNDRLMNYEFPDLNSAQLKFNGLIFPEQPIDLTNGATQAYIEYARAMGKWNIGGVFLDGTTIDGNDFVDDRFVLFFNLDSNPGDGLVNPLGTTNNTTQMLMELRLNSAPAQGKIVESIVWYLNNIYITPRGKILRQY